MRFTVFTPSYNRADLLPRLYHSLLAQTCFDFEWLIVDDGSADDTPQVVNAFTGEGHFPVRYLRKENGGKHTAHNLALQEARGDWFWCVDSDDLLAPSAIADLSEAILPNVNGIVSYKTDLSGNPLCSAFPVGLVKEKFCRLSQVHGCHGEYTLAFPTDYARKFPFPVFTGERFIGESVIYDRMDRDGEFLLLPKVTTLCEYQPGGLSGSFSALMAKNPNGFCLYFLQRIDLEEKRIHRFLCAGKYWAFRLICRNKDLRYTGTHRFTVGAASLIGPVFRLYYKLLRNI